MTTLALEDAITAFLTIGRGLMEDRALTGERALDALLSWYASVRVEGAAFDRDEDMMLLQWGATRLRAVSEPTDLRAPKEPPGSTEKLRYLDITRQLHATGGGSSEFDDSAVQLSASLGYEPADGTERAGDLWIASPSELANGRRAFIEAPLVRSLLHKTPRVLSITVVRAG
jgi:hypothetical protein